MTRTLSIGNDRLLESSLSTFDGRSAPASRKTAARPTCRRAVPCPRIPQLVRPAPRLFRRGGLLRVPADVEQHARHLGGRGGVGLAGHQASGDQLPATSEEPSRAGPRVLADREGHRRPAPLAARRVAPREDPGTLDEKLAHERAAVPRDAARPPALGARAPRGREAEVGRGPSRARACRRAAPGRGPWRPPRPWPPARRRRPRPTRRPREPRGSPPRPGIAQSDGARPVPEMPAPAPLGPAGRRAPVPRHAVSARDRTRALARRLADAGQVARRPVRLAQPPGPLGDALAGPASPARANRARPPRRARRPPRGGVNRPGRETSGRPRTPPTRISSWLTGGRRSRGMHDGWSWGPSRRSWRLGAALPRRDHPGSREVPLGPRPRDKFHSLSSGHIV